MADQLNKTDRTTRTQGAGTAGQNPRRKKKRKLRKGRVAAAILILLLIIVLIASVATAAYVATVLKDLPDWDESVLLSDKTTFLYDEDGNVFSELHSSENRTYVTLDEMPQYLIDCFLASEDARFYSHHGIDVIRIGGALLADIKSGGAAQGASTITMQLARTAILNNQDKKLERKVKEAVLALQLEKEYSKDDILNLYLNEIYFGHSAYGVQAASQTIFGKDVSDIDMAEAATLVGIIRNPKLYSPLLNPENSYKVKNQILDSLADFTNAYTAEDIAAAKEEVVETGETAYTASYNHPWYTDYVIDVAEDILTEQGYDSASIYTAGFRIYTTLNPTVQDLMESQYADSENFPSSSSKDLVESAMVVLDTQNSAVLGLVGGREYTTKRGYNRATDMKRQPGSTFKPIGVYAPAIEQGYSPATVANDAKTTFSGNWTPGNYDGSYKGIISMRTAAQYSVNIATVKFLQMTGVSHSLSMLKKMGIQLDENLDNNLSIALGGLTYGVSPLQMAAAYGTLANSGVYTEPWCISRIEDTDGKVIYESELNQTIAMKETTAYLVTDMLKTVTSSGTGTRAQLSNRDVASKTGTVQLPDLSYFQGKSGNRDAWFAAYTPEMVGVVWMGYDNDKDEDGTVQYLHQIYGGKYPALIWKSVIGGASQDLPSSSFKRPNGIVSVTVDAYTGMLPDENTTKTVTELFDKDNVPTSSGDNVTTISICTESKFLANEYCPEVETIYTLKEPDSSNVVVSEERPTEYCTIHQQEEVTDIDPIDIQAPDNSDTENNNNTGSGNNTSNGSSGNNSSGNNSSSGSNPYGNQTSSSSGSNPYGNQSGTSTNTGTNTTATTTPAASQSTLSAPTNVKAEKRTNTAAYVSWNNSNSGSLKYQVEYWEENSLTSNTITTYFTDLTISNLKSGSTYSFRVRTLTDSESVYSSWSSTSTISLK
jgi:penicillin-binding protein 1A